MSGAVVVRLDDYRTAESTVDEVAQLRAEVARLRAVVVMLSDSVDLTRRADEATTRVLVDEAFADGWRARGEHDWKSDQASWPAVIRNAHLSAPTHAELETRRYGPGGRASWLLPDEDSPNYRPEGDA